MYSAQTLITPVAFLTMAALAQCLAEAIREKGFGEFKTNPSPQWLLLTLAALTTLNQWIWGLNASFKLGVPMLVYFTEDASSLVVQLLGSARQREWLFLAPAQSMAEAHRKAAFNEEFHALNKEIDSTLMTLVPKQICEMNVEDGLQQMRAGEAAKALLKEVHELFPQFAFDRMAATIEKHLAEVVAIQCESSRHGRS